MAAANPTRVLLIGNGGREHALAWKLSQSQNVEAIFVAPGNGGTSTSLPKVKNVEISVTNFEALVSFALKNSINLVVPGPEVPLVEGIESHFRKVDIPCFGPSKLAARMEGSKTFSKDFMQRHNIPTAEYKNFTIYDEAVEYINNIKHDVVIKASGLAAGKGVIIPTSKEEAIAALKHIMVDKVFADAGDEVVIEEFLTGPELSILSFSDGHTIVSLPPAQDHKRIGDGDVGLNTGGMGCYSPIPNSICSKSDLADIETNILQPTIDGMRKERFPFVGILFTGLMRTPDKGFKVLEYNVRFGDPETQTVLPLLSTDTDLAEVMLACCGGYLDAVDIKVEDRFAATVVVAAGGYPETYVKADEIKLSPVSQDTIIFHAGTSSEGGILRTNGGRVLAITATASTLEEAVKKAYTGVSSVKFEEMYYRKDIAHRAFAASQPKAEGEAITYASAGVSIDAGNTLVQRIKPFLKKTARPGADAEIGGFGGIFDLSALFPDAPCILAAIDGVGTKLKLATMMNKHDTVGIDLVAMNVNDLVVQGAEPLFFLDYFSSSKLEVDVAVDFVKGVCDGCVQAGCTLGGGETAEMPGMYSDGEYDTAGVAIGAIYKQNLLPRMDLMTSGDVLIGLASNGVHSNGFSLIRAIITRSGLDYSSPAPWNSSTSIGLDLLTPTRIYVKPLLSACKLNLIKGMAHITGGGLTENIPRMLPKNLSARVDVTSWPLTPLFSWLKKAGNVKSEEFARAWNTGLGMVCVVSKEEVEKVKSLLEKEGETVFVIGDLVERGSDDGCSLEGLSVWDN